MAKKFFGKVLDIIGLEETALEDEEEFDFDEGGSFEKELDRSYNSIYYDDQDYDDRYVKFERGLHKRSKERAYESKVIGLEPNRRMKMIVYQPMTYDDTQNIIDNLKSRKPVIVNLENMEVDIAQRVLDFMSGATYALNGNIQKISRGIFVLAPNNVDVTGNIPDELKGKSFYTLGSSRQQRRDY